MMLTEYRHPGLTLEERVEAYLRSEIGAPVTRGLIIDLMDALEEANEDFYRVQMMHVTWNEENK